MDAHEKAKLAGIASGIARQTQELIKNKAEEIRLHTQMDMGISAISTRTGINKGALRRWLVVARVYLTGHRSRSRDYGHKPRQRAKRPESILKWQHEAFVREWAHVLPWDEQRHWSRHPVRLSYNLRYAVVRDYQKKYFQRPHIKFIRAMRLRTWKMIRRHGGIKRLSWTRDLLGCNGQELRAHLEAQFKPGMAWDGYGTHWEVDHIRPCASFNLADEQQQRECFHFTNLQPLTITENRRKSDKTTRA